MPRIEAHLARPVLGLAPRPSASAIADEIEMLLADPAVSAVFAPGSMAEVPVTGRIAGRAYSGWIDRLVGWPGGQGASGRVQNRPRPARARRPISRARILRQVAAYRALLGQIYPGRRIDSALIWTVGPVAMAVPDALLEATPP